MGKLSRRTTAYFLILITGLIAGILIGSIGISMIVSYRMDNYHKRIVSLENIIEDKEAKMEKLEDIKNSQYISLQDIELDLSFEGDQIDKIDIEKAIKEKYKSLIGKNIKDMDGNILAEVVDKRIFKIEKMEYKLKVEKLILSEVLKLYIKVELND